MGTPTITDVAEASGVSRMTVSFVLNRKGSVSPKTRERVLKSIHDLGYKPDPNAIRLSRSRRRDKPGPKTKNVGCIVGMTKYKYSDPFFGEILEAIENELIARGYYLIFTYGWKQIQDDLILRSTMLSTRVVDGLILMQLPLEGCEKFKADGFPLLSIDSEAPDSIDSLASDHLQGGYRATKHLIELGHKRIVYVGHPFHTTNLDRIDGYRRALREAGLPEDNDLILHAEPSMDGARTAVQEFLSKKQPFTAIFAHNDGMACGVMKALQRANLSVPRDVSVIGYNDDYIAKLLTPELTTVAIDKTSLGRLAAIEIIERINGVQSAARKYILPIQLKVRETTGPVPAVHQP